jgi:hypothetical protein
VPEQHLDLAHILALLQQVLTAARKRVIVGVVRAPEFCG